MAQPKEKSKSRNILQRNPKLRNSGKTYLRNFGKGELRIADDSLKFYLVKGRFSKQKNLAKQIQMGDIENVTLQRNELDIKLQFENQRFIIKNRAFAKYVYGKIADYLKRNEKPTETVEEPPTPAMQEPAIPEVLEQTVSPPQTATAQIKTAVPCATAFPAEDLPPPEEDIGETLTLALSTVDSLFDALMCLHGRVNWKSLKNHAKQSEKGLRKLSEKKTFENAKLDSSLFFSSVAEHNVDGISQEGYRLLASLYRTFQKDEPELQKTKEAVKAYFLLNDIILASVVADPNIEQEISQLTAILNELPNTASTKTNEITEPLYHLIKEQKREPYAEEARTALKNQLATTNTNH